MASSPLVPGGATVSGSCLPEDRAGALPQGALDQGSPSVCEVTHESDDTAMMLGAGAPDATRMPVEDAHGRQHGRVIPAARGGPVTSDESEENGAPGPRRVRPCGGLNPELSGRQSCVASAMRPLAIPRLSIGGYRNIVL
jgi:hypothetical protein